MQPHIATLPGSQAQGRPMAYREWTQALPDGRVLVCVHGLTRNGRDFDKLACSLSESYRVICPDMPGRGKSAWLDDPAGYSYPAYLADVDRMFDGLQLPPVDWVGTSMGGILGMMIAALQPQRIKRLVLNDVGACIPRSGLLRIADYIGKGMEFVSRSAAETVLRERYAGFGITDEADWQRLIDASLEDAPGGGLRLAYDPAIAASFADKEKIQDVDLWPVWEKITCPVLILRGAHSDILLHETAARMQRQAPARVTYVELPEAGHAPSLMREEEIALVRRWLLS